MQLLILIAFGFVLMWVFIVLPQRRRMSAHARMVGELAVGDEVLTAGGLFGNVTEIGEDEVAVEIAPGVEVRVAARAIASVVPPDTYDDSPDEAVETAPAGGDGGAGEAGASADAGGRLPSDTSDRR